MEECIFCKIIKGEIPSQKIYEDDDVLAFLDVNPVEKGHTLIITKEHYHTILDIPEELLTKVYAVTKKLTMAISKAFEIEDFNILQNNGIRAGQTVSHYHVHIIPRHREFKLCLGIGPIKTGEELIDHELCNSEIAQLIRKEL
ncbi:MAG: HIT family protein [Candidatus Dojkabacteria bacterium]|jgi:histidine triad (HIT) family protein|nr:HIT family protein [Candidatus Dojkabacteria bacterium]MDD2270284.1 HIT family protein [Candidatus Dojkabacteria bacterium]